MCYFEENALKHVANTSKSLSTGYEKPKKDLRKGHVVFDEQLHRKDITSSNDCNPHEGRFEPFEHTPSILSKFKYFFNKLQGFYRHPRDIDIERTSGHDPELFNLRLSNIQYNPKYDFLTKRNINLIKNRIG